MGNSFPSVTMEIFKGCQSPAIMDFPIVSHVMWELSVLCTETQGLMPQNAKMYFNYHGRKW